MNKNKTSSPNSTILVLIVALNIFYIMYSNEWAIYTSVIIGVISVCSKKATQIIHNVWMGLAKILSFIVPNILLSLIFFLFLFPLSFLSKLFRGNNLLKLNRNINSLWTKNERPISKEYFEKPW